MKIEFDDDGAIEMRGGRWKMVAASPHAAFAETLANIYLHKDDYRPTPSNPGGSHRLADRITELFPGKVKVAEKKLSRNLIY